jgi:predicted TPR repeat methyltransferase
MVENADTLSETQLTVQPPAGDMSLADALALAVRMHRSGEIENAEKIYRRILEVMPEQPDALNFLAMIEMHHGRLDHAIALMQRSLAADPEHGERYNNLGNLLLAAVRVDEAVQAYEEAIARCPETPAGYNNLGIIYRAQGRFDASERLYKRALELDPVYVEAWNNYGNLCCSRGDPRAAIRHYGKALLLRPSAHNTRQFLALAHIACDDYQSAAEVYRQWLKEEPDHPGVKHLIAALSGKDVPPRASDEYIEMTFDRFAESFDSQLAFLQYRAPQLVAAAVEKAGVSADKNLVVLDAGCGTGLCGPLLAPYAAKLTGIDLSSGMLDRARPRGVYDELVKAELTQFLQSRRDEYDLVVSADTLCYFGKLDEAILAAASALRAGGMLVFTVERAEGSDAPKGHRINPHGRYSHVREYVDRTLANAGFAERELADDVLRREGGLPVNGLVVTARKLGSKAVE